MATRTRRTRRGATPVPPVRCRISTCKGETCDNFAATGYVCHRCKMTLDEGDRVYTCKRRRCKKHQCHFCVSGEARPAVADSDDNSEDDSEGECDGAAPDIRGMACDGVPKRKTNETDVERLRRERLEVKATAKQRIINAKTNGLSRLCKLDDIGFADRGKEPILVTTPSAKYGGVLAPYVNDAGDGIKCYSCADVNAADPSGRRWGFRRFQEVFPEDEVVPAAYRGCNIFVLLWVGLAFKKGDPVGHAMFFVCAWEHITKKANKVKPFCLVLRASDFKSVAKWVNPAKAENTHLHAFTRKAWGNQMLVTLPKFQGSHVAAAAEPVTLEVDMASPPEALGSNPSQPPVSHMRSLSVRLLLRRLMHVCPVCPAGTIASCAARAIARCWRAT